MLSGIFTALALIAFLGVCGWAYSRRRRDDFAAAARLPLDDERPLPRAGDAHKDHDRTGTDPREHKA